ncbi:protein-tyrosine phosphatase family protein [Albidovulum sp.]|uniref:protein-tyrosine phosphatase family protein n=1 Tax=Albidovulum sp. TaxID=1872424 RepID=UPI0039B83E60
MERFGVAELAAGGGRLALCPMPGRAGDYAGDLAAVLSWAPGLVVTMATAAELALGAAALQEDLAAAGIAWRHLPVADFAAESAALRDGWAGVSAEARAMLGAGGRVLVHCLGGCGRSGMAVLRLMVECGEAPEAALARLRQARPCAIETEEQRRWAARS